MVADDESGGERHEEGDVGLAELGMLTVFG